MHCKQFKSGFKLITTQCGDYIPLIQMECFTMVFLLEGKVEFSCGDSLKQCFCENDFFFLPCIPEVSGCALEDAKLMMLLFDSKVEMSCDDCSLYSYLKDAPAEATANGSFRSLYATPQIRQFEETMAAYLQSDKPELCNCLRVLKQQELFILLTYNYTKKELTDFFYPVMSYITNFKQNFLAHYRSGLTIGEIASKMNMSMRNFSRRFCQEFGMNARQWLLDQKAKSIKVKLSVPGVTIADIIIQYDFTDLSHFTKFCKHYYGCTPAVLCCRIQGEKVD